MASVRLDNIPEDLLKRLELAASSRKHDLNTEVLDRLDASFGGRRVSGPRSHTELSELARRIRGERHGTWLTPEFIRMAREWGRE